jgi:FAD/FMN-containing dehydrogenase
MVFMTEDEGDARVRAAYGDQLHARLREIKAKFDPENLFHGAQNIPPR